MCCRQLRTASWRENAQSPVFWEEAMSNPSTARSPDAGAFSHMHTTASQYHLHYSNVRTLASTLYLSFGLLASVELFLHRSQSSYGFAITLLLVIYFTTLVFNLILARWSRACRQIERFYERKITTTDCYVEEHGFRHLFQRIVLGQKQPEIPPDDFPAKLDWSWRASTDAFVTGILVFGFIYIIIYSVFFWIV
jgi:hypothetical protein